MKELWVEAFDQLMDEFFDKNEDASEVEAYNYATANADSKLADNLAMLSERFREDYRDSLV